MPKDRVRKKKNPQLQVVKESEFIMKKYNGKPMRVKNPRFGKTKVIVHSVQSRSSTD